MNNPTYQERVHAIAEQMAQQVYAGTLHAAKIVGYNQYIKRKRESIGLMMPAARIAVEHMAAAYEQGRAKGYELGVEWSEGKKITITPKFELIGLGLIPDSGREAGEDGK